MDKPYKIEPDVTDYGHFKLIKAAGMKPPKPEPKPKEPKVGGYPLAGKERQYP